MTTPIHTPIEIRLVANAGGVYSIAPTVAEPTAKLDENDCCESEVRIGSTRAVRHISSAISSKRDANRLVTTQTPPSISVL